jgi:hypothetical protein
MSHVLKIAVIASAATFAAITGAQAGIPIPCTGDKIVKVAGLPKNFVTPDGKKVDLGYMFQWCFTGKWVGYVGSNNRYLNLPEELLLTVAAGPDGKSMPTAPSFWVSAWANKWDFFAEWLWLCMLSIIAGGLISNKLFHGTFAHPSSHAKAEATAAPSTTVPLRGFGKRT